ncbi:MAG: hypothetical protein KGH49_02295 [Candidatus Micrarchaeota archaeon]|nr:hypothetical protein [Candidatus Micrarchaeota archaeon]
MPIRSVDKKRLAMLDKEPTHQFRCEYCSNYVPSFSPDIGICPFCELSADKTTDQLKANKPLFAALSELSDNITNQKFDDIAKSFSKMEELQKSPQALYAKGVISLMLSDKEYTKRDYATPNGYMEDNADAINIGLVHFSAAKAAFFAAISLADKQPSQLSTYTKFLAYFRLKDVYNAKRELSLLKTAAPDSAIAKYADMLYCSMVHDKKLNDSIAKVVDIGIPNAFFYYSDSLAKGKNFKEAKRIIDRLLKNVEIPKGRKLLLGIERAQTIM